MPLVWAHAEYLKLRRSLEDGEVFDMPSRTFARYVKQRNVCSRTYWRFEQPCRSISTGITLRLEVLAAATVRWTRDDWQTAHDSPTIDTGVGLHYADLSGADLKAGEALQFTFHWTKADRWEGRNFEVCVRDAKRDQDRARHVDAKTTPARRPSRSPTRS